MTNTKFHNTQYQFHYTVFQYYFTKFIFIIPCNSALLIVFFTGGSSTTMWIVTFLKNYLSLVSFAWHTLSVICDISDLSYVLSYLSKYPLMVILLDRRFLNVISPTGETKSKSGDIVVWFNWSGSSYIIIGVSTYHIMGVSVKNIRFGINIICMYHYHDHDHSHEWSW